MTMEQTVALAIESMVALAIESMVALAIESKVARKVALQTFFVLCTFWDRRETYKIRFRQTIACMADKRFCYFYDGNI